MCVFKSILFGWLLFVLIQAAALIQISENSQGQNITHTKNVTDFVAEIRSIDNNHTEDNTIFDQQLTSLIERIDEFAANLIDSSDEKIVFDFVRTAALSMKYAIRDSSKQTPLNWTFTLENSKLRINKTILWHSLIINQKRYEIKDKIEFKTELVSDLIKHEIEIQIETIFNEMKRTIVSLAEQIVSMENETAKREEKLVELKSALLMRQQMTILRFVKDCIKQAIYTTEPLVRNIDGNLLSTFRVNIVDKMERKLKEKAIKLMAPMEMFEKAINADVVDPREEVAQSINSIRSEIVDMLTGTIEDHGQFLHVLHQKVATVMKLLLVEKQRKKQAFENESDANTKNKKLKVWQSMKKVETAMNEARFAFDFDSEFANDEQKVEIINNEISRIDKQLNQLDEIHENIQRNMASKFHELKSSLNSSSLFKWNITDTMINIKQDLHKISKNITIESKAKDLKDCYESFHEAMSLLINVYNNMDLYYYATQLSVSLEKIGFDVKGVQANSNDSWINEKTKLRSIIKSNLEMKHMKNNYNEAVSAFKLHWNPVANEGLEKLELPQSLRPTSYEAMKERFLDEIKKMVRFPPYFSDDSHFYSENLFYPFDELFYVWKYSDVQTKLKKFLRGEVITVRADINESRENGYRFSQIGIHLEVADKNLQSRLDSIMNNFKVRMTIMGNSNVYKCGNRLYSMPMDEMYSIYYYQKINFNYDAALSPFTTWQIQLESIVDNSKFNDLKEFENEEINIELKGSGNFMRNIEDRVCTHEKLHKYYEVYSSFDSDNFNN